MMIPRSAALLRIFIGEADRADGRPLYEAIVLKAREMQLAGATVLRGPMGFGHSSRLHTAKILRLSEDLPFVVEIVDSEEKINAFLPVLDDMMSSGLVTLERVQVLQYGTDRGGKAAPDSAPSYEVLGHLDEAAAGRALGDRARQGRYALGILAHARNADRMREEAEHRRVVHRVADIEAAIGLAVDVGPEQLGHHAL